MVDSAGERTDEAVDGAGEGGEADDEVEDDDEDDEEAEAAAAAADLAAAAHDADEVGPVLRATDSDSSRAAHRPVRLQSELSCVSITNTACGPVGAGCDEEDEEEEEDDEDEEEEVNENS